MSPRAKKPSRSRERERLIAAARAVDVPASCDVAVVGGGASGLVAAITAAEEGASVVVLERDLACGRTVLATGNGRCNFANISLGPRRYNDPAFVTAVAGERYLDDILDFFRACGLRWSLEDDRLYPVSRQAASVRNVLLARARRAGVVLACARTVTAVTPTAASASGAKGAPWTVAYTFCGEDKPSPSRTARLKLAARSVVLAVGGGVVQSLAAPLGLALAPDTPVLAPLACEDSPLAALDGRRAVVAAQAYRDGFPRLRERGEVLFRDYGLSGIVSFDLSRHVTAGDVVALDLLPDSNRSEILQIVDPFMGGTFEDGAFDGLLDPAIAALLTKLARAGWELPDDPREDLPRTTNDTERMIALVKGLPFRVTGVAHPELAQVTRGGIATGELDPATLATASTTSLFACGEAVDVDADCGGFNLAWAWKSGMVAGKSAAQTAKRSRA